MIIHISCHFDVSHCFTFLDATKVLVQLYSTVSSYFPRSHVILKRALRGFARHTDQLAAHSRTVMFLRKYRATAKELEEPLAGTPKKKLS